MSANIDDLRKQKEKLEREREEVERQLAEAERREREKAAQQQLDALRDFTTRIDALKEERAQLLGRIREAAPRIGDFTYAADDYRLSLPAARASLKQPELFDRLLAALHGARLHLEPRAPRFRIFRGLRPVGTVQVFAKRIVVGVAEPVLDPAILEEVRALDAKYPGLASAELASVKKERRLRESFSPRAANGDYAIGLSFSANDTGSLDTILPLALHALDHVATWWEQWTPDLDGRVFEPWPAESPIAATQPAASSSPASTEPDAPVAEPSAA